MNDNLTNLIMENQGLIYKVMSNFKRYPHKSDLYQVGCIGLIKAFNNFNKDQGCKLSTYAYMYIFGEMRKLVREDKGIKISNNISKLKLKIEKAYILWTQQYMHEPSIRELSNYLEIPEYYVAEAVNSMCAIKSIDEPINDEGRETTYQDIIGYSENIDELILLRDNLFQLSNEEREIINNRYMNDLTQSETSQLMGMSQVQVSRKEKKILEKLKHQMT